MTVQCAYVKTVIGVLQTYDDDDDDDVVLCRGRQRDTAASRNYRNLLHEAHRRRQLRLRTSLVDTGSRLRRATSLSSCYFDVTMYMTRPSSHRYAWTIAYFFIKISIIRHCCTAANA